MLNNVILVGRITKDPELMESENKTKRLIITLAITRNFKNQAGEYETDFVRCVLWNNIAEHTCEYCKKGDIIGIKGRIQTSSYTKEDETYYVTDVIAEKISFISSKKQVEEETSE